MRMAWFYSVYSCFPLELMLQGRPFAIGERC